MHERASSQKSKMGKAGYKRSPFLQGIKDLQKKVVEALTPGGGGGGGQLHYLSRSRTPCSLGNFGFILR